MEKVWITAVLWYQAAAECCTLISNGTTYSFLPRRRCSDTDKAFKIWRAQFGKRRFLFFPLSSCAAWGSAWGKSGWVQLVSEEQSELRGSRWNQGQVSIFAPSLCREHKRGWELKRLLKADVSSAFRITHFPPTRVSTSCRGWSKYQQRGSEPTVNSASLMPLS